MGWNPTVEFEGSSSYPSSSYRGSTVYLTEHGFIEVYTTCKCVLGAKTLTPLFVDNG